MLGREHEQVVTDSVWLRKTHHPRPALVSNQIERQTTAYIQIHVDATEMVDNQVPRRVDTLNGILVSVVLLQEPGEFLCHKRARGLVRPPPKVPVHVNKVVAGVEGRVPGSGDAVVLPQIVYEVGNVPGARSGRLVRKVGVEGVWREAGHVGFGEREGGVEQEEDAEANVDGVAKGDGEAQKDHCLYALAHVGRVLYTS